MLDLFSGSGSLGIEALSRGATKAYFCDKDLPTVQIIKRNLRHCKLETLAEVYNCDFKQLISKIPEVSVSLVFLDPPYETGLLQIAIEKLFSSNILTHDAIIVAEHPKSENLQAFNPVRTEQYGDICITFIKGVGEK